MSEAENFNYPAAWKAFWERWKGEHSMLRCPGDPCPGGCGPSAKDELAILGVRSRGWRGDYPRGDRPPDDAPMEVWCMLGGLPVHRFVVEVIPGHEDQDDLSLADYELGDMESAFFGGRGCETAFFLWAMNKLNGGTVTPQRAKDRARSLAAELQDVVDRLKEVAGE